MPSKKEVGMILMVIDAADAAEMYPQGHGDAYGHYLTAPKDIINYWLMKTSPGFQSELFWC